MKIGIIARADDRGLGTQTWEVARHLPHERVLVVREPGSERQGFRPHLERFPDATVAMYGHRVHEFPDPNPIKEWLDGLDVVYSAETLYDWRLADWARDVGCSTVVHTNPEFFQHDRRDFPAPTAWWSATPWRLRHLPNGTRVVPMPVPIDRWPAPDLSSTPRRILHVGGRSATGDRNGTNLVLDASRLLEDIEVVVCSQDTTHPASRDRHVTVVGDVANYWEMYEGSSILLMPRRYGGLCLPVIEGCGAGLVPVMPDCEPNRMWPIAPIPVDRTKTMTSPGGELTIGNVTPEGIARTLNGLFAGDLPMRRNLVRAWAQRNSWDALTGGWLSELERAAERGNDASWVGRVALPREGHHARTGTDRDGQSGDRGTARSERRPASDPPGTPRSPVWVPAVSIIVPITPGDERRDRAWAWLKQRYRKFHPDWEIIECGTPGGPWSKGTAVAEGAERASGDVFIVADADCWIPQKALLEAVHLATLNPWVVPHSQVCRLDVASTERTLQLAPIDEVDFRITLDRSRYPGRAGGGIVVLSRATYEKVGPPDPRFTGWGGEDASWGRALNTLVGSFVRLPNDLWHLWHPPQAAYRRPSVASKKLADRYTAANRCPDLMRELVAEYSKEVTSDVARVRI